MAGQNAPLTRSIKVYPVVSGSTALVEYRGSHYDVVAIDIDAYLPVPKSLLEMTVGAVAGMSTSGTSNTAFTANIDTFRMTGSIVKYANINGIAHHIVATEGLEAGVVIRCSAIVIST